MEGPKSSSVKEVLEEIAREAEVIDAADIEIDSKLAADLAMVDLNGAPIKPVIIIGGPCAACKEAKEVMCPHIAPKPTSVRDVSKLEEEVAAKIAADNDFGKARERWVKESDAFHRQEMTMEDNRYRIVVSMNPKTDEDWKDICHKMFGGSLVEKILTSDLHAARSDTRSGLSFDKKDAKNLWQNTFKWLSRSEQFFMRGMRMPQWVEPCYDELFMERLFEEIVPVGVGYDHAVILGRLAPKTSKKVDLKKSTAEEDELMIEAAASAAYGQDQSKWTFFVCNISKVPSLPRPVNWRNLQENKQFIATKNNVAIAELKKASPIAYVKASCGQINKPAHVDIHGDWVSVVWTKQQTPSGLVNVDILHLYKLPKMLKNPGDFMELFFPDGLLTHYELQWPYLVFVCNNQEFFDIVWTKDIGNFKHYKKLKDVSPIKQFIFVINVRDMKVERAWEVPGTGSVGYLSLYPPKNSVLCASVAPEDVKVMWTCEDEGGPTHRALFEDYMLRSKSDDIEVNYMWKKAEHEIELRRTKNISYKSPPDEPARSVRRFHGGHTVMISDNNVSTLVMSSPPLYKNPEIYFGRDQIIVDRAIYLNTVVTLFPDYTIAFSCARAAEADKAISTVSRFTIKDLVDWGDNPGRVQSPPRILHYKAIWMAVDRIVIQFQDGMLLFLSAMSEQEVASMKDLITKARLNKETKTQVQNLVEKKVMDAANELVAKQKADAAATKGDQSMEH